MKLRDFAMASVEDYIDLNDCVNSSAPGAYIFDNCELPDGCVPGTATIGISKSDDGYGVYCYDNIDYCGYNTALTRLFRDNHIHASNWSSLEEILRSLGEECSEPPESRELSINGEPDVADWDNITVSSGAEPEKPLSFEELSKELNKTVIGQPDAVDAVSYSVAKFLAKKNPKKPLSLLAYGPPGIGKSETAKSLADVLSRKGNHAYSTVWTDLNTFTEAHTVYRLIGSPPGYVGYEDKPVFEAVSENPYTIFIFDELDKAHPQVLKTFMAILDEGRCASRSRLPDGSREYDFKHCIFFFTSNYVLSGDNPEEKKRPIGFSISDNVKEISYDDGAVEVAYTKDEPKAITEENITQRIYRTTECARREFIKCGTLAEIASRFHGFVEYKPLSKEAKAKILAKQIIETGFEYGVRIGYISKDVMQGIIDEVSSENSLTVRSFKAVIEGRLVDAFVNADTSDISIYKIEGTLDAPKLIKM